MFWRNLLALSLAAILSVQAQDGNFQSELEGTGINAVFPNEPEYTDARQAFNQRYSVAPATVTYPNSADQVAQIVQLASEYDLRVTARSGGHSYVANGLGGTNGSVVVDLSQLTEITVHDDTGTATIGTGNRLGPIALALNAAGRGLPHGSCAYVGIGGHSGHGGFGFSSRMWGLTVDTIVSMEVVLANGTLIQASKDVNADLFWAMRGAASSFGITTAIEVKTFPIPSYAIVFQYFWQFNYTVAADALDHFQNFVKTDIPPELGGELVLTPGPKSGTVSMSFTAAWYGDKALTNSTVEPFIRQLPPYQWVAFSGNGTWIDNLAVLAGGPLDTTTAPPGTDAFYAKSLMTPEAEPLSHDARIALMKYLSIQGLRTSTGWFMQLELYGGSNSAINAVPLDDTSFGRRNSLLTMQFYAYAQGNKPPYPAEGFSFLDGLVNGITSSMPEDWDYGAYVNYIDDRLPDSQKRYYGTHYDRLRELKRQYDPNNTFSFPTSIEL